MDARHVYKLKGAFFAGRRIRKRDGLRTEKGEGDPLLEYGMKTFGGKWKPRIACVLNVKGTPRYSDPRRGLVNVSDTVLSSALRELEVDGIVGRTQYGGSPSGWSTP